MRLREEARDVGRGGDTEAGRKTGEKEEEKRK